MSITPVKYQNVTEWRWPSFSPKEMACKSTSEEFGKDLVYVDPDFMDALQKLRTLFGKPLIVTSGYRTPIYNATISSTGENGPHTTGQAVDLAVCGEDAHKILSLGTSVFTGIGLSQKGAYQGRFIHLDTLERPDHPRPWVWTY